MGTGKTLRVLFMNALLFIYSFAVVQPFIPVVKDAFAHVFDNVNHMATLHYENGSYHLHVEMKKEGDAKKEASKILSSLKQAVHLLNETQLAVFTPCAERNPQVMTDRVPDRIYLSLITPPPRA